MSMGQSFVLRLVELTNSSCRGILFSINLHPVDIIVACHYVPPSLSNGEVARKVLVTVHVPVCRQLNCRLWAAKMFGW